VYAQFAVREKRPSCPGQIDTSILGIYKHIRDEAAGGLSCCSPWENREAGEEAKCEDAICPPVNVNTRNSKLSYNTITSRGKKLYGRYLQKEECSSEAASSRNAKHQVASLEGVTLQPVIHCFVTLQLASLQTSTLQTTLQTLSLQPLSQAETLQAGTLPVKTRLIGTLQMALLQRATDGVITFWEKIAAGGAEVSLQALLQ
jgi:hypothetical protein